MPNRMPESRVSQLEPPATGSLVAEALRQFSGKPALPSGAVSERHGHIAPPTLAETMLRQRAASPRARHVPAGVALMAAVEASGVARHRGRRPAWTRWAGIAAAVVGTLAIAAAWPLGNG